MPETPHSDCSWRISGREVVVISSRKTPLCGLSVFDADVVVVWMPGCGAQRRSAVINRKPATFLGYAGGGAARAVEHLRNILATAQVASLPRAIHIGMIEMMGMMREGKSMADYPYLDDYARPMLDELVWWANTLKEGRSGDRVAEAA